MSQGFVVHCPACAAGYLLPRSLVGALGARVTCPGCGAAFEVDAAGERLEAPGAEPPHPDAGAEARALAAAVLDELAGRHGAALAAAAAEGRLFRDHGPELLTAFDEYRRRAGERGGAPAFREELRRRWRVDLFPLAEARG